MSALAGVFDPIKNAVEAEKRKRKMTRDEYNAKVQEIQAMWPDEATRIDTYFDKRKDRITSARFQVYWDGHWETLGIQTDPFTTYATYEWMDQLELRLRGKFADALIHS